MMYMYTFITLSVVVTVVSTTCNFPPSLWCSSEDIAKQCQVTEQCKQYLRAPAAPIDVTLYYESLCPDCKNFISTQLWRAWNLIPSIMKLTLVPFGNAEEKQEFGKWKFRCQHGPEECVGNVIETCAINITKDINIYFPFIHCMENSTSEKPEKSAEKCSQHFKVDYDAISKCAKGDMGNELEHQMALKTNALNPQHKYVPWVTINGVHTEDMEKKVEDDLVKFLCDMYKGEKPAACNSHRTSQVMDRKCLKF